MASADSAASRILIVRLSAMGDLIHGIPVLCALRQALPQATLGWVAEGRNADLLQGHPDLDHLVRVPRHWWKSPRAVLNMRRNLRALNFDTTLDLQCLSKSALAARLSGAPRRIGYAGSLGREVSRYLHNELVDGAAEHVIDRYLKILRPLGIENPVAQWNLPETADDGAFADQAINDLGLVAGNFAIANPGAGWASKRWPTERYGELARRLAEDHDLQTLAVWGGPDELPLAETIAAAGGDCVRVAPATTMTQLAALARRARLFVGSDTGPLHLAVAVGTPSVSLHGTSLAAQTCAYGPANRSIQVHYDNSPGKRRTEDDSAKRAITVDHVVSVCDELLSTPRQARSA